MEGFFILIVIGVVGFKIFQFFREEQSRSDEFEIDLKPPLIKRAATPVRRSVETEDEVSVSDPVVFSIPPVPGRSEPPPLKSVAAEPEELPVQEVVPVDTIGSASEAPVEVPEVIVEVSSTSESPLLQESEPNLVEPEQLRIVPEDDAFDLYEAGQTVFLGNGGHYAATQRFEGTYEGERLEGGGRLVRVDRFSNDRFFGRGPGTIATVELEVRSEDEQVRSKTISVLLALPDESRDEMKRLIGKPVKVGGTAIRCDVFSSKLYLVESEG